jgi:hypothetical protein
MTHSRGKRAAHVAIAIGLIGGLAGCFGDGTTLVGNANGQTKAGLYTVSVAAGGYCYWERLRNTSGQFSGIIENGIETSGRVFLQVLPTDRAVSSNGCGNWDIAKATSYNTNRATAKPGAYRVRTDLLPGTYTAPGGSFCYWERLRSWTGNLAGIVANNIGPGRQVVTIASTDTGFSSHGCGNWTRTGP